MTLHTLNKSGNSALVGLCIAALDSHDCLLLIEDGVFIALDIKTNIALLSDLPYSINLYVLSEDLAARGSARIRTIAACDRQKSPRVAGFFLPVAAQPSESDQMLAAHASA